MKIMKVVYKIPQDVSDYDGSNAQHFMGEDSWAIGDIFNGEFIKGKVTDIYKRQNGEVQVEVNGKIALGIAPHDVSRIYYGE